jgi:tetratricopeptide (TPR) repeat protein
VLALALPALAPAQPPDPRTDFLQALARFSLALDGAAGDEAGTIRANLDMMAAALERWDATIRVYETGMQGDLPGADAATAARLHAALAGVYLDRGRLADARRELTAAAERDAGRADVQLLLGLAYSQGGPRDAAAAAEAFGRAAALDPDDPLRAYLLARHLASAGDMEAAAKAYAPFVEHARRVVVAPPGVPPVQPFLRLGLVQEASGVEPFFPPVLYAEGFAQLRQGAYVAAGAELRDAAARDPLLAPVPVGADDLRGASAAFRDGDVNAALDRLEIALSRAPDHPDTYRVRGMVLAADGQLDDAIDAFERALRLAPRDERVRLALADALLDRGDLEEAERMLQETITLLPASGRARYRLGRVHHLQGRVEEAIEALEAAANLHPLLGLNGIYQRIGTLELARQNFDGALDAFARRVDVHPNDPDAHYELGDVYLRLGRHVEALAEFTVVLLLDPRHTQALVAIGQTHLRDGRDADAVLAADRALALSRDHQEAQFVLATALRRLDRTDEAARALEAYRRLEADDTAARTRQLELGSLRRQAALSTAGGDHEDAVARLREALALDPRAESHVDLALVLLRAGRTTDAVAHLEQAVAMDAPAEVHRHLAEAYASLGRSEDHRRQLAIYEEEKRESIRRRAAGL